MMVMFPLTFVSNIFVDPKTMPGWLQAVVKVNPITHLATVVRGLMDGTVPAGEMRLGARLVRTSRRGLRSHHHGPLPQRRSRCRYREHLVDINSDNPAHSANAIPVPGPDTARRAE